MKKITLDLKALASEPRLTIIHFLHQKGRTVSEIAERLQCTAPTVLYHLAKLSREGYILRQREGKNVYYSLKPKMKKSRTFLRKLEQQLEN